MADINRRNFLQLLGIGAAASIVPVPLFASEDRSIWTPDDNLLAGHIVLTRPAVTLSPGGFPPGGAPVVGGRYRWPKARGQVFRVPENAEKAELQNITGAYVRHGSTLRANRFGVDSEVDLVMVDSFGEEPHVDVVHTLKTQSELGYYKASMQLRDSFKEDSMAMFSGLREYERHDLKIVTLVNVPIFVGALDTADWREYMLNGEDPPGFRVSMDYVQYLVRGELDYNGWVEHSNTGQFPLETPSKMDWDYIYSLDRSFLSGDLSATPVQHRSRIILP